MINRSPDITQGEIFFREASYYYKSIAANEQKSSCGAILCLTMRMMMLTIVHPLSRRIQIGMLLQDSWRKKVLVRLLFIMYEKKLVFRLV